MKKRIEKNEMRLGQYSLNKINLLHVKGGAAENEGGICIIGIITDAVNHADGGLCIVDNLGG